MDLHFITAIFPPEPFLAFLRTTLIDTRFLYVDVWTLVHIGAGALIATQIKRYFPAIAIILGFEVFESILMQQGVIRPETAIDLIGDIVFTVVGYLGARKLINGDRFKYQ